MRRRHQCGLSLLEFTLVLLIVSVLTLLAFERIAVLQSDMERAQVRHTIGTVRSALALQYAELAVEGKLGGAHRYDGGNALAWLSPPPSGYDGERASVTDDDVRPGVWYYATGPGLVVYRPRDPGAFEGNEEAAAGQLYWRVVVGRDKPHGGGYDGAARGGIALIRATARGRPLLDHNDNNE